MSKSHCKCKTPECEECPEWIFTFADLVMLMMGFFVILWVLKPAPGEPKDQAMDPKWLDTVAAIREAFGHIPDPQSKDPVDMHMLMKKIEQLQLPLKNPGEGGDTRERKESPEGTDPLVTKIRPGTHVGTGGRMLFRTGDATLDPPTVQALDEIVRLVKGHRTIVVVKGHTSLDDFPAEGTTAQQQMDLSLRRAQAAADYLTGHGVSPDIVRVQGCSTFEPVVQRQYVENAQAANRRVEVEATDQRVQERQDTSSHSHAKPLGQETKPASATVAAPVGHTH